MLSVFSKYMSTTVTWSLTLRFQTDTRGSNMITTDSGSDVMHRVTRSDLRATLGNKLDPGFWPARGRRSNFEDMSPPFWANRWWFRKRCAQELLPYWTPGDPGKDSEFWRKISIVCLKKLPALPRNNGPDGGYPGEFYSLSRIIKLS
jgi:hypothetical protein